MPVAGRAARTRRMLFDGIEVVGLRWPRLRRGVNIVLVCEHGSGRPPADRADAQARAHSPGHQTTPEIVLWNPLPRLRPAISRRRRDRGFGAGIHSQSGRVRRRRVAGKPPGDH